MPRYRYRISREGEGEELVPYDVETVDDQPLRDGVELLEETRDALLEERGTALESLSVALLGEISNRVKQLTGHQLALEAVVEDSVVGTTGAIAQVNGVLEDVWSTLTTQRPAAIVHVEGSTETISVADAIHRLRRAIQLDDDYRWGWWCNLVMAGIDSGASRAAAEGAAEQFMGTLFNVNMSTDPQRMRDRVERYTQLICGYLSEDAADRIRATIAESIGDIRVPESNS